MGLLIPQNFPMESLVNDAERLVVSTLVDRLTDGWFVIPDVGILGSTDRQMDIVVAHESDGVAVIEVKGHRAQLEKGVWCSNGRPLNPQPLTQAKNNAYELRALLRAAHPSLERVNVEYGVVFPNTNELVGHLPPDADRAQFLLASDMEDPMGALDQLMTLRWGTNLGAEGLRAVVESLCPDAQLVFDPEARARLARLRLNEICASQVQVLETLDANRRVMVTGGAGSGKTRLAMAWARRASLRGERVLLTCYNDPLAAAVWERFGDDELVTVDSYFDAAFQLEGMPELEVPSEADGTWWDTVAVGHLQRHWGKVTDRFDAIVVDEAQDFSPSWIAQLQQLLDPDGPRRMLMVADESQAIYTRGFTLPLADDGWVRCELVNNCRNTHQIASLLHQFLGGPPAPVGGPEAISVRWMPAEDLTSATEAVGEEIDRVLDDDDREPERVLVLTVKRTVRDHLRAQLGFVPWEESDDRSIACETVHRAKGLEFDHVILVLPNEDVSDALLYIGISRAISGLTVVAPSTLATRIGLVSEV